MMDDQLQSSTRPAPWAPGREAGDSVFCHSAWPSLCGPGSLPWSQTRSSSQRWWHQIWAWRRDSQGLLHGHLGCTCLAASDPGSWQELFLALLRIGTFGAVGHCRLRCFRPRSRGLSSSLSIVKEVNANKKRRLRKLSGERPIVCPTLQHRRVCSCAPTVSHPTSFTCSWQYRPRVPEKLRYCWPLSDLSKKQEKSCIELLFTSLSVP